MAEARTAADVRNRIQRRFGKTTQAVLVPEHLVLFEVTIDGRSRYPGVVGVEHLRTRQRIDAIAIGMWRSTDHLVHGFEIKVSRSDLLHELRDPTKAEAGARACDRWWLALGDPRLLRDGDDVPAGWGVLAAHGRGLRVLAEPEPQPGDRDGRFLAGLMQAALRQPSYRRALGYQAGLARGIAIGEQRMRRAAS